MTHLKHLFFFWCGHTDLVNFVVCLCRFIGNTYVCKKSPLKVVAFKTTLENDGFVGARRSGKSFGPPDRNFRLLICDHQQSHRNKKLKNVSTIKTIKPYDIQTTNKQATEINFEINTLANKKANNETIKQTNQETNKTGKAAAPLF